MNTRGSSADPSKPGLGGGSEVVQAAIVAVMVTLAEAVLVASACETAVSVT
jgi:hypothetical protein